MFLAPLAIAATASPAFAQLRAELDVFGGLYPSRELAEARSRLLARYDRDLGRGWLIKVSAYAEGGVRESAGASAILRPHEIHVERSGDRLEVRLGYANLPWGVLDEVQPTDRVNPLDVARFALDGRAAARLPVPLLRARVRLPAELRLEAVWVPFPRRGTFDELDEPTSPFNPVQDASAVPPRTDLPWAARHMEFGGRLDRSSSGWDFAVEVYRDVVDRDLYEASVDPAGGPPALTASRPARWMFGGEFETTFGAWTARGEAALDLDDPRQVAAPPAVVQGRTFQGGLGVDRGFGETVLSGDVLFTRRSAPGGSPARLGRDELGLVLGFTRPLPRGAGELRLFALWNTVAQSGFARAIYSRELVENLRLQVLGGLFWGESDDPLGLLRESDFAALRLKMYF